MTKHVVILDEQELATVLAALRHFQKFDNTADMKTAYLDHFEEVSPLQPEEIGVLCERINTQYWGLAVYIDRGLGDDFTVYIEDGKERLERCYRDDS